MITAQSGNVRLATMLKGKGLEAHQDKTGFIIIRSEKFKQRSKKEIAENPLMFGEFEMKEKASDKYLGQILHGGVWSQVLWPLQRNEQAGSKVQPWRSGP